MDSRRNFLGKVATGIGTFAAVPRRVFGANDRIRVGFIGFGARALDLLNHVRACPNTETVAFCDVYTRRLERAQAAVPGAAVYVDFRRILDDPSIDAVIIATPLHLHAAQFCDSLAAGKHVYQERAMAFDVEHAKRMRSAWRESSGRLVVEIGHQACSSAQMRDARMFLAEPERFGKIAGIEMRHHRNTPKPRQIEARADEIAWDAFLGDAPRREFDARRFLHWRDFWDYSTGNIHENLSQQLAFWYKALDLRVPVAATAIGGAFSAHDAREVPDTLSIGLVQPEGMLISWTSGAGNNQLGAGETLLGRNGAIVRDAQLRYIPQKMYRPDANEMTGRSTSAPNAHLQDFFDAIRAHREPSCPFDLGWRVSVACRMAAESLRQARTVRWDAEKEEII